MSPRSILRLLAIAAATACAIRLPAQSYDLANGREPLVSLDQAWRFHPGDSPPRSGSLTPLWASPAFDDSAWPILRGDTPWSIQGYPAMSGYAWYRFTLRIPAGQQPVSLLLAPILSAYELYLDGVKIGGLGDMHPSRIPNTDFSFDLFPLTLATTPADRTLHLAIRVWHSPIWATYVGGGPYQPGSVAGDPRLLASELRHHQLTRNIIFVDLYVYSIAAGLVGLVILWLYLICREREYLWFAAMLLAQAADCVLGISRQVWSFPPIPLFDLADGLLVALVIFALFCFLSLVLKASIRLGSRILLGLVVFSPFPAILYWPGWFSTPVCEAMQLACSLPAIIWLLFLLIRRAIQANMDALLLLAPILLVQGFFVAYNFAVLLAEIGWTPWPEPMERPLPLPPFTMHIQILLNLFFLLAMMVFLIRRFTRARRREVRLATEFEAARQVQQVLLPDALDQCPGFAVGSSYQPAEEVGGDFFQQIADGSGGLLIVVGDVSGKGLPAALLVSVLVGAIRAEAAHGDDPATLLHCLNERILARAHGGFVTCLAAHISAQGQLNLANAGHLAPYLNGREIDVPGSLPLGIIAGARYESLSLALSPGDRLTFVSDGVIEAQSRSGELFGFDRTRLISRQSAESIAHAAQNYGQSDDITVVTVDFSGTPSPSLSLVPN